MIATFSPKNIILMRKKSNEEKKLYLVSRLICNFMSKIIKMKKINNKS